jgi:hypothetical protein
MDEVQSGALAPVVNETAAPAAPAPEVTATPDSAPQGGEQKPEAPPEKQLPQSEVDRIVAKEKAREARRVERLIREQARAEAERDFLRQQIERQNSPRETKGEPQRKDFESDEQFYSALLDHRVEQRIAERESKRAQETAAQRQQREAAERADNLKAKIAQGRDEYGEDFEERIFSDVPFTEPMVRFFEESDMAHKVMHELSLNVTEAARIAKLSPISQIRELDKIEARLKAPPKTTQAPPPIVPNGTKTAVDKDPSKMTDKEFAEWRKRQIAQRR